ncbi:MAG: S8 family serine peptidase [Actinobacteria bacterium]|nr:S8 family serine peptidase [Actinomycetota bacterium]
MKRWVPYASIAALALITLVIGVFFIFSSGSGASLEPQNAVVQTSGDAGSFMSSAGGPPGGAMAPDVGTSPSPSGTPSKTNPKVESVISDLASTQTQKGAGAAADFASSNDLDVKDGKVKVVLESAPGSADSALLAADGAGAVVETTYNGLIQADVPVDNLSQLAASADINYIRQPRKPVAFTTSEGVADIGANIWQGAGYNGAGAKIAVLDPGFTGYQNLITAGELPANVITQSFVAGGDINGGGQVHGAACAEIVYDTAPGAQLYLVNFSTDVELGNAVNYLISQGVNVISASWGFYSQFQGNGQGSIDNLVQQANTAGITWANASGNAAQTHWSGPYTDANADTWSEFAPGVQTNNISATAGGQIDLYLTWNKWPATDQDYDLYLYKSPDMTTPVATSTGWQNGSTPPSEEIHYTVPAGKSGTYSVMIKKYSATGDAVFQLYSYPNSFQYQVAASSLGGQPADSAYAMTVGAVPFGSTNIEYFSSQGPTLDGRTKPDLVGPDGVSTVTYGYHGFYGTSASTPHAAGAAALVKGANPTFTPAQVQSQLEARATDLGAAGKDNVFGSGKLWLGALPDSTPPIVSSVQPSGTIYAINASIVANYSDAGSGVNTGAVSVTLDGSTLAGCTVTASQVSCPATGLATGAHTIGGSVADKAGNTAPISGYFTVACSKPQLSLGSPDPFWASYADYVLGELSVTFIFSNTGADEAFNLNVVGSVNTNGTLLSTIPPVNVGNLAAAGNPGSTVPVTVKYSVPQGVSDFRSTVYSTVQDVCGVTYSYPAPYATP